MGVETPEELPRAFSERFNRGDAATLLELYDEDAVFTYDGVELAVGKRQIEGALQGFMSAGLKFNGEYASVMPAGDIVLVRMKWDLRDPSGALMSAGISAEVLKRGADGRWRFLLADAGGGMRGWQDVPTGGQIQA